VHVLNHLGGGMAPWNVQQYEVVNESRDNLQLIETSSANQFDAVFYHYHYVRFYSNGFVDFGWFKLGKDIVENFYTPYVKELHFSVKAIQKIDPTFKESLRPFSIKAAKGIKEKLKILFKLVTKYNLHKVKHF
jgi:hypothetical protein